MKKKLSTFLLYAALLMVFQQTAKAALDLGGTGFLNDDQILNRGEVSDFAQYGGALVGTLPTLWLPILSSPHFVASDLVPGDLSAAFILPEFGFGQFLQGRFGETGWIVAVSEVFLVGAYVALVPVCDADACENNLALDGLLLARGFEVYDLWAGPTYHNRRFRELQVISEKEKGAKLFLNPKKRRAGIRWRF